MKFSMYKNSGVMNEYVIAKFAQKKSLENYIERVVRIQKRFVITASNTHSFIHQ